MSSEGTLLAERARAMSWRIGEIAGFAEPVRGLASDRLAWAQSGILHTMLNFATTALKGFIFSTFSALGQGKVGFAALHYQ